MVPSIPHSELQFQLERERKMKSMFRMGMVCLAVLYATVGQLQAGFVTSYDIDRTQPTGYGGWSHSYNGSVASNGDGTFKYSGGSGTMNDGVIGTAYYNTQLFQTSDGSKITLYLDQSYTQIDKIRLYSFAYDSGNSNSLNSIPGNITSVDVTIDGLTNTILTTGFGGSNNGSSTSHELLLTSLALQNKTSGQIQLSNFQTDGRGGDFSISEITFQAVATAPVPEPATIALFGIGALGIRLVARRRKKQSAAE